MGLLARFWRRKDRYDSLHHISHTMSTCHDDSAAPHSMCSSLLVHIIYRRQDDEDTVVAREGSNQLYLRCCTRIRDVLRVLEELHGVNTGMSDTPTLDRSSTAFVDRTKDDKAVNTGLKNTQAENKTASPALSFFWVDIHGVPDDSDTPLRHLWQWLGVHPDTVQRLADHSKYDAHAHLYHVETSSSSSHTTDDDEDDEAVMPTTDEVHVLPLRPASRETYDTMSPMHTAASRAWLTGKDEIPFYVDMQLTTVLESHSGHDEVRNVKPHSQHDEWGKPLRAHDTKTRDRAEALSAAGYAARRVSTVAADSVCEVCNVTYALPPFIRSMMAQHCSAPNIRTRPSNSAHAPVLRDDACVREPSEPSASMHDLLAATAVRPVAPHSQHREPRPSLSTSSPSSHGEEDDSSRSSSSSSSHSQRDDLSHATHTANTQLLCFAGGCVTWCRSSCTAARRRNCLPCHEKRRTRDDDAEECRLVLPRGGGCRTPLTLVYRPSDHGLLMSAAHVYDKVSDMTRARAQNESGEFSLLSSTTRDDKRMSEKSPSSPSRRMSGIHRVRVSSGESAERCDSESDANSFVSPTRRPAGAEEEDQQHNGDCCREAGPPCGFHVKGWRTLHEAVLTRLMASSPQEPFTTADFVPLLLSVVCHSFMPEMNDVLSEIDAMDCIMSMIVPEEDSDQADTLRRGMLLRQKLACIRHLVSRKIHLLQMLDKPAMRTLAAFMCPQDGGRMRVSRPAARRVTLTMKPTYNYLLQIVHHVDYAETLLSNIFFIYTSAVTSRNARFCLCRDEHMIWLQLIFAISLPLILVSGQWGMNCRLPGDEKNSYGPFWKLIGGMSGLAMVLISYPMYLLITGKYRMS